MVKMIKNGHSDHVVHMDHTHQSGRADFCVFVYLRICEKQIRFSLKEIHLILDLTRGRNRDRRRDERTYVQWG